MGKRGEIRKVHVDQGRMATNKATRAKYPVLRVDQLNGAEVQKGHRLEVRLGDQLVGYFVQIEDHEGGRSRAHFLVAEGVTIRADDNGALATEESVDRLLGAMLTPSADREEIETPRG